MNRFILFPILAFLLVMPAPLCAEDAIKGSWYTDPDEALTAAKKAKKPILAAAMDHG